jgi:hypothetical protein
MNGMMDGSSMTWGMGSGGGLVLVLGVLIVAALLMLLFSNKRQ